MKKFIFILLVGITFFIPKNIVYGSPIILSTETWNEKEVEKIFEKYYGDFEDYEKLDFVLSKSEKEELIIKDVDKSQWQLVLKEYEEKYNDKKKMLEEGTRIAKFKYNFKYYYKNILILILIIIGMVLFFVPTLKSLLKDEKKRRRGETKMILLLGITLLIFSIVAIILNFKLKEYFDKSALYIFSFLGILGFIIIIFKEKIEFLNKLVEMIEC